MAEATLCIAKRIDCSHAGRHEAEGRRVTTWTTRAAAAVALGIACSSLAGATPSIAAQSAAAPVSVTMVVALTAPPRTSGLIDAELLANYTSEFGLLTKKLNEIVDRPVAIGIDPSIIASIRILGSEAPESALAWLDRLAGASNETFPLSWADSDLTLPLHAGSPGLLEPESFDFAIDPSLFASVTDASSTDASSTDDSASPTPTTSPDADADELPPLPTAESLVAWGYSVPALAWPALNSVTSTDLTTLGTRYDHVLLSSTNVGSSQARQGHATVNGVSSLIADDRLSALFGITVAASSGDNWSAAMSQLATSVGAVPSTVDAPASILIAVDRSVTVNDIDMGLTISTLANSANVRPLLLTQLLETEDAAAPLSDADRDEEIVAAAKALLLDESRDREFSLIAAEPQRITAARRLDLLATLSNASLATATGWAAGAEAFSSASAELRDTVKIVKSSSITLWADRASLPVTVSNELDQPVTVFVTVRPRTPLLKVENSRVELRIESESQRKASVPVQSLSNGTVQLDVSIVGELGNRIGDKTRVSITVQAGWETPVTLGVAIAVVLIFVAGIVRTVIRRRRAPATEA